MTDQRPVPTPYQIIHHWHGAAHVWGECDCMLVLADWVRAVRGFDPAADLRGTYGDPDVCAVGRAYRADPLPVCRRAFGALPEVARPAPGDIALLGLPGQRFLFGALRLDDTLWAMKLEGRGVVTTRAGRAMAIWGVGYAP